MRLWSIHPKYLDSIGLVALWREGLLAKKVLEGKTRGYKHHPQLKRFKEHPEPIKAINAYLFEVFKESQRRGFNFDKTKIEPVCFDNKVSITTGQLEYEFKHLLRKLKFRDLDRYKKLKNIKRIEPNPIFEAISGEVEEWEIIR